MTRNDEADDVRAALRGEGHRRSIYRGIGATIIGTKAGSTVKIALRPGQNSFGEPGLYAGKRPANGKKEFAELRGWPLYAIQVWLVGHGYTYEVK